MARKKKQGFVYQVLNIKLMSNSRKGAIAYSQLLNDIYVNTIHKPIKRGKRVLIRSMFPAECDGGKFYYGNISRFTDLENSNWLNLETKSLENPEIDKNLFPNLQETVYVFVPEAHRFIIIKSPDFTIRNAADFFSLAIKDVISNDEEFTVSIYQSSDIFEEIYNAHAVEKLYINISYTNSDDIGEDAIEWMDEQLKQVQTSSASFKFEADHNKSLNMNNNIIKGSLGLAEENGSVVATVIDNEGKRKKIITEEHPEEKKGYVEKIDDLMNYIYREIIRLYRPRHQNGNRQQSEEQ